MEQEEQAKVKVKVEKGKKDSKKVEVEKSASWFFLYLYLYLFFLRDRKNRPGGFLRKTKKQEHAASHSTTRWLSWCRSEKRDICCMFCV